MRKYILKVTTFIACAILVYTSSFQATSSSRAFAQAQTTTTTSEATTSVQAENTSTSNQVIVITRNSKNYTFNGTSKQLTQPVVEKNGTTFIPLKSIAELYGFKVSYESKTKESIAASSQLTLAFKQNSNKVKINGTELKDIPTPLIISGSLMVPLRAWSELTKTKLTLTATEIKLEWQVGPSAAFKITNPLLFANQTTVQYEDLATTPNGAKIVNEKWTGKEAMFTKAGKHTITRQVQDEFGVWSIPYSLTVDVLPENLPPVASFTTNKEVYKLGEPITYYDQSTDDVKIKSVKWTNDEPVFFTSGKKDVTIEVEDIYGLKSTLTKSITVSDEVMYTKEEYDYNFAKQGEKITIDSLLALRAATIPYTISPVQNSTVVRLNGPEQLSKPGLDYRDTLDAGQIRFSLHKQNQTNSSFQLSIIATNKNDFPVTISNDSFAMGGPALYVNQSGKAAATRFLENIASPNKGATYELLPGQSVQVLPKEGTTEIKPGRTVTMFSDYTTTGPLEFTSLVTAYGTDPLSQMNTLAQLPHDNKHVRGTFKEADRRLSFISSFGSFPLERIVLGDRSVDTNLVGVDAVTGNEVQNAGNGAVRYAFSVDVKPNTFVMINGRGGIYAGAILVNNKVVPLAEEGTLSSSSEAVVLYRTGEERETLYISFIPAPGSNLPLNILFAEVPAIQVEDINKPKLNYTKK